MFLASKTKDEEAKMKFGANSKVLKAGGAVALAGLCVSGVATGIACPILMGAAGTLAFSAMRRKEAAACPACEPVALPREERTIDRSGIGDRS
jgi:hypothetical protein